MPCFDVTLKGYDPETDTTDHLVKWVSAPDAGVVCRWIDRAGIQPLIHSGPDDLGDRAARYGPQDGVDLRLGADGRETWSSGQNLNLWRLQVGPAPGALPRLICVFRPQVWVNDYAMDMDDGRTEFDATDAVLAMPWDKVRGMKENSYDTDELAEDLPELQDHSGPFEVDFKDGDLSDWLGLIPIEPRVERQIDLTEESWATIRMLYGKGGGR